MISISTILQFSAQNKNLENVVQNIDNPVFFTHPVDVPLSLPSLESPWLRNKGKSLICWFRRDSSAQITTIDGDDPRFFDLISHLSALVFHTFVVVVFILIVVIVIFIVLAIFAGFCCFVVLFVFCLFLFFFL